MSETAGAAGLGPCAGVRVLDFARYVAGPFCGQILADLGAEVIKVEDPMGELMRHSPNAHKGLPGLFAQYNRGKKSIVADMRSPEGLAMVRKLIDTADIVLENFRPGVMEKLGLGYDVLKKTNPRLIYLKISGFGETGPYVDRPAFDQVIQGMVGFMPEQGNGGPPSAILSYVVDKVTAIWTSNAALAALLHRANTGLGQKVSTNMLNAYAALIMPEMLSHHTFAAVEMPKPKFADGFRTLQTADGHVIGLILTDGHFRDLCAAAGCEHLLQEPRFAQRDTRSNHMTEFYVALAPNVAKFTTSEFLERAHKFELPFAKVNDLQDLIADPQAQHNRTVVEFEDPEFGRMRHINHPSTYELSRVDVARRAPKLGEHTDEIRKELAG